MVNKIHQTSYKDHAWDGFSKTDHSSPEIDLWNQVLEQAIRDALNKSWCNRFEQREAAYWFTTPSKDFNSVCDNAGLNPEYVRRKAVEAIALGSITRQKAGDGERYEKQKLARERRKELA